MLERFGQSDVDGLYQRISLNGLTLHHVAVQRLHADTTTISFSGAYDTDDDSVLRAERGYNKDGRSQDEYFARGGFFLTCEEEPCCGGTPAPPQRNNHES